MSTGVISRANFVDFYSGNDIQTPSEETTTCFIKGRGYTHVQSCIMNLGKLPRH